MKCSHLIFINQSICDDQTAKCIKPSPTSVTKMINFIKKKYDLNYIRKINLSGNNINSGFKKITDFIINNLPNLESIDLSNNKIENNKSNIKIVKKLINKNIKINISNTELSSYYTKIIYSDIIDRFGIKFIDKVKLGIDI